MMRISNEFVSLSLDLGSCNPYIVRASMRCTDVDEYSTGFKDVTRIMEKQMEKTMGILNGRGLLW